MNRLWGLTLLAGLCALSTGCAMCCAPLDCDYPCVAGSWVRTNPTSGRVGSLYDPAGEPAAMVSAETVIQPNMAAPGQPVPGQMPPSAPLYAEPPANMPPANMPPTTRSVIPRRMGESYLPTRP